jgi:putative peptidoglycan lipid II flippase
MNNNRWQQADNTSINRKIFSAAMVVAMGTAFVKVLAVVKELVVAWKFGTSAEIDAFLIALTIPSFIFTVVGNSFNAALIPTYIKVREREGRIAAQKLFAGATIWSIGLLTITTGIMLATAPLYLPKIAGGFSPKTLELTYQLLWMTSPMVLLSGINTVWGAVLNAGERFALVALAPILTPALTMIFLLTVTDWGVFSLSVGLIGGQLLELLIVGRALRQQGISLAPRWYGFDSHMREVASQYAPMIAGAFLMCSSDLVDRSMAALLPSGSVASLSYGNKIIALPITIATTALSTAVIPYFSQMVAQNDWKGIRRSLDRYLGLIFIVTIPLTGAIILCSEPIVRMLLQRGSFTASNSQLVAQIQACFALQIPFYIASILVVRLISAMRKNHILMWGSAGNLIINISMNYLLMQWLGVKGIALSTSFVYIFSFFFLLFFTIRNLQQIETQQLVTPPITEPDRSLTAGVDLEDPSPNLAPEPARSVGTQKLAWHQESAGLDLTMAQISSIKSIRQSHLDLFRDLLTPEQKSLLKQLGGWERGLETDRIDELHLTETQQAQLDRLWAFDNDPLDEIQTPKRLYRSKRIANRRQAIDRGLKSLNFSIDRQAKLRELRRAKDQQLNSVLTPEQKAHRKSLRGVIRD